MQALEVWEKDRLDQLEVEARPLGNLGNLVLRSLGAKQAQPSWVNEFSLYKKAIEAREVLPAKSCKLLLELDKRHLVPEWVINLIDYEYFQLAAK